MLPRDLAAFRLSLLGLLVLAGSARAGDDIGPARLVVEESLVWRTRVEPRPTRYWSPLGIAFGVGKPGPFQIDRDTGLPFLTERPMPKVVQGAKAGWETEVPVIFFNQPEFAEQQSDAPQFGTRTTSDVSGLRLGRPTFHFEPPILEQLPIEVPAWMPDGIEFRSEMGSNDVVVFTIRNGDPKSAVTFHNLRFTISRHGEIPLEEDILLDQTIPLAHPFSHGDQADHPPVVRPKAGFRTFAAHFPEIDLPITLQSGADSREFMLGDLPESTWLFVEGFATRVDRNGNPILNAQGLPEEPSEFRYGFRLARKGGLALDLTKHKDFDGILTQPSAPTSLPWQSNSPLLASTFTNPFSGAFGTGFGMGPGGAGGGFNGGSHVSGSPIPPSQSPGGGTLPTPTPSPTPNPGGGGGIPSPGGGGQVPVASVPEPLTIVGGLVGVVPMLLVVLGRRRGR